MTLKHCIIHYIERSVPGADIGSTLREQENSTAGPAYSLFEQLKQSFQRSAQKQYGFFDRELADNPLPAWVKDFHQDKSSFERMSQRLIESLQQQLANGEEAFSAHLLIAVETIMDQDQLYIFWIHHIEANQIDSNQDVIGTRYVDGNKLHYGARIYIDEWLEMDSQKYLCIMGQRGNKELHDAFEHFIGFASGVDLIEDTGEFLGIVDQYTESLPPDKVGDTRSKILDYCVEQDKKGSPIVFEEISSQLNDEQPAEFSRFVEHNQQIPKPEIYADRNSLKRYVRYFGRDKNMSISFSADLFGAGIVYDEQAETLTITEIPKSLKQQLRGSKS